MPDQWVYREPQERHSQTQFAPWTPRRYSQTDHLAQMRTPPQEDLRPTPAGRQPAFRPTEHSQYPRRQEPPAWQPAEQPAAYGTRPWQPSQQAGRKTSLTAAEQFWYVLMCIGFGAGYFAKIPTKKALSDFGLAEMTAAEKFWYVLMCIPLGAGYFAKVTAAKAIEQMQRRR
ncbi:MAG: hypothetical protein ACRDP7_09410 [Trebonia sp.]